MAHQPYPATGRESLRGRRRAPQSIQNAVKLMYAGAAIRVLELIVELATLGSLQNVLADALIILIGLLSAGLWFWMARANAAAKSSARVLSSVLFGIFTLQNLVSLARTSSSGWIMFDIVFWAIGLSAIVFLWRRESSEYYAASRRPR